MKTAMGMEKAKVWISETVGTKIATRLFRGVALGVLLVAATGLYFSINQGEAGSPLASEQTEIYPEFLQTELWLPGDAYPVSALSRPLSNREFERLDYEADMMLIEAAHKSSASKPLSNREIERLDYEVDITLIEGARDTVTTSRLSSEQLELIHDLEMMGFPWRIDDRGRVVVVEAPRESVAETVIYRYDRSLDDEFMSDAPFFHALKQGKASRPSSINWMECYPELQIC